MTKETKMKLGRWISTSWISTSTMSLSLSLGLGFAALICGQNQTYAQQRDEATQPQREQASPEPQQEPRPEANKPDHEEMKPSRPGNEKTAEQSEDRTARSQEQEKQENKQQEKNAKQDAKHDKNEMQQRENDSKQADHAKMDDKSQRTAGTRIPDDKFRSHFGRQHTFKVHTNTSGGRPQFAYGGYNFTIVEAWPVDWAYTDECYIDYIDGEYFLFDLAHPGIRIAVIVL
jgi:cytoskeletal protein RodZ